MKSINKKVELLAPAGNFEKLEIAVHYGADAVYLAGKDFSLRNLSGNFSLKELKKAIAFCRKNKVKAYVACNIFARNSELGAISEYLSFIGEMSPDAVILADPGIFNLASKTIPHIPVHISTQANTTNIESVLFWQNLGAKRINIARELTLTEIREITLHTDIEIEAFVHGAMCIAYSGRCLLSNYLAKRDSNRGMCAHACRWKYYVVEETRPGINLPIEEDERGTYILSSKDLCMIELLPSMIKAGICSLKIEGRMKSIHYLATVVKTYREAIDEYYKAPDNYFVKKKWTDELSGINNRGYSTGFYLGDKNETLPECAQTHIYNEPLFVGKIISSSESGNVFADIRNRICKLDSVEIITRKGSNKKDAVLAITDEYGAQMERAHPGTRAVLQMKNNYSANDIIRKTNTI